MFEVKTRFRFSSEGGVGEKTRFGGGRFVIGTPSLSSHKPISHFIIITPTSPRNTKKIGLIETNPI